MSILDVLEQQFQEALLDHEQRVLVGLLARQLPTLTFADMAAILNSPLGQRLGRVKVITLFEPSAAALPQRSQPTGTADDEAKLEATEPPRAVSPSDVETRILHLLQTADAGLSPAVLRGKLGVEVSHALKTLMEQKLVHRQGVGRATRYLATSPTTTLAPTRVRGPRASPAEIAVAVTDLLAKGSMKAAELRRALQCTETVLVEALNRLRDQGVVEKWGHGSGSRYGLASGVPREPVPEPSSPTPLSSFDAAVLNTIRTSVDWIRFTDLRKLLGCSEEELRAAMQRLVSQARVRRSRTAGHTIFKCHEVA